jgi:hypothetical protein
VRDAAGLDQGAAGDLDLQHRHAAPGVGALDLVVEAHTEQLDLLALPLRDQLRAGAVVIAEPPR